MDGLKVIGDKSPLSDSGATELLKKIVTNDDHTIETDDGFGTFEFITGAVDRVCNLPLLAENLNRTIKIIKNDSGSGKVIIDGNGAESIFNGISFATLGLLIQGDSITLYGGENNWIIVGWSIGFHKPYSLGVGTVEVATGTYFKRIGDMVFAQIQLIKAAGMSNGDILATVNAEFRPTGDTSNSPATALGGAGATGGCRILIDTSGFVKPDQLPNSGGNTVLVGSFNYRVTMAS